MSHIAWSVCLCVYMFGTRVSCAKTAEPIEMPLGGGDDSRVSKEPWGQGQTNPFAAARGDNTAMRPFARLLLTLVNIKYVLWVAVLVGDGGRCGHGRKRLVYEGRVVDAVSEAARRPTRAVDDRRRHAAGGTEADAAGRSTRAARHTETRADCVDVAPVSA